MEKEEDDEEGDEGPRGSGRYGRRVGGGAGRGGWVMRGSRPKKVGGGL